MESNNRKGEKHRTDRSLLGVKRRRRLRENLRRSENLAKISFGCSLSLSRISHTPRWVRRKRMVKEKWGDGVYGDAVYRDFEMQMKFGIVWGKLHSPPLNYLQIAETTP